MTYVAMARKWRPESFKDLVGQEHVARTIENAITGNRLHHAFLFTGTRGVGKTTSARILARTLNCPEGDPVQPCGKCNSCREIAHGSSMDVLELDGASNNGVENVREIIEQVKYAPMHGRYKVFVVDEVHMLSKPAFNALLKTLEEPPPHVVFIFATTEVNKVPATILSRVQRFDFKRISCKQIVNRLQYICKQEGIEATEATLSIIGEKADGSMRDALTFFDQAYSFCGKEFDEDQVRQVLGIPPEDLYFRLLDAILQHNPQNCFTVVEWVCAQGMELSVFLDGFARFLRNLLFVKVGGLDYKSLEINEALYLKLLATGSDASTGDLLRLGKMLSDLISSLRYAVHPRFHVESTFVRMSYLDRVADLRKLLSSSAEPGAELTKKKSP